MIRVRICRNKSLNFNNFIKENTPVTKKEKKGRWPSLFQVGTAALGLATAAAGGYAAVCNKGKGKSDGIGNKWLYIDF
jgi:hypothetical protein